MWMQRLGCCVLQALGYPSRLCTTQGLSYLLTFPAHTDQWPVVAQHFTHKHIQSSTTGTEPNEATFICKEASDEQLLHHMHIALHTGLLKWDQYGLCERGAHTQSTGWPWVIPKSGNGIWTHVHSLLSSAVLCSRAGFWHPFSESPSFSVRCPSVWIQHCCRLLPNHVAIHSPPSCWFTPHSAFYNFMHNSIMSQDMANPSSFLCQIECSICLSSFTLLRTSSSVTLSSQLFIPFFCHIHISKASNFLPCPSQCHVCFGVHTKVVR